MEKKKYTRPQMTAERFQPQEYVAVCGFVNATSAELGTTGYVYVDLNHDGKAPYNTKAEQMSSTGYLQYPNSYSSGVTERVNNVNYIRYDNVTVYTQINSNDTYPATSAVGQFTFFRTSTSNRYIKIFKNASA
ncbi:MAG: hypothetical protein IJK15_00365 [Bacteroidaceae bacterium]|nr:hypothetical protein [Bacteroidaceae bacterium]